MSTIEKKKIVMDFMGLKPKSELDGVYSYSDMPFFSIRENDIDKVIEGIAKYAKYNTDWNWLMPVVDKILKSGDDTDQWDNVLNELQSINIDNVFNACVEFIQWYNENKL